MPTDYNPVLYELLHNQLKAGKDLEAAISFVGGAGFATNEEIQKAATAIRANLDRCYNFNDPASITDDTRVGLHRWYVGPTDSSKNWWTLRGYLGEEGRTEHDLEGIDRSSSRVVSLLPSPGLDKAEGRGLVMGYVQSGKTTNFMSVAAKCADEGYRLIVVLSGVTNNLRNQTQERLYGALSSGGELHWHWLTGENLDFTPTPNASNTLSTVQNRSIMVIKKNAGRLQKLIDWLESVPPEIRAKVPMLIIDDEADQASVNTAKGKARRSAINDRLLRLMGSTLMPLHAYVGYTATPFANMLIDPNESEDLFPRDFIVSLPKGEGYFGAEQLFGRDSFSDDDDEGSSDGADLIREISKEDVIDLGKAASVRGATSSKAPDSLKTAIRWFFLATAARRLRSQSNQWSSMLIHASGRLQAHDEMQKLVNSYLSELRNVSRLEFDQMFEAVWIHERDAAAELRSNTLRIDYTDIADETLNLVMNAKVIVDNSRSQDRLDYRKGDPEFPVLVVGGNTLARGLTLEGLVSSYFLRTSNAYDSLLQMGRWFGYRVGYEDLQRIWMPPTLANWFRDLATVESEIRAQIEQYSSDEVTPRDVPVLIRTHPKMQVTSAARAYNAIQARVGLSEKRLETILFDSKNSAWLQSNLDAGRNFVTAIQSSGISLDTGVGDTLVARGVPVEMVKQFLSDYSFFEDARIVNKEVIFKYIDKVLEVNELESWNVFFATKANIKPGQKLYTYVDGVSVAKLNRAPLKSESDSHANIKALANPSDAARDTPLVLENEFKDLVKSSAKSTAKAFLGLRERAGYSKTGLLGIYIIDKDSTPGQRESKTRGDLKSELDILGLTFFFPKSQLIDASVSYIAPPPYVSSGEIEVDEDEDDYIDSADKLDDEQAN